MSRTTDEVKFLIKVRARFKTDDAFLSTIEEMFESGMITEAAYKGVKLGVGTVQTTKPTAKTSRRAYIPVGNASPCGSSYGRRSSC